MNVKETINSFSKQTLIQKINFKTSSNEYKLEIAEFSIFKENYKLVTGRNSNKENNLSSKLRVFKVISVNNISTIGSLSLAENHIYGFFLFNGQEINIEPISYQEPNALNDLFIIYNATDRILDHKVNCGLNNSNNFLRNRIAQKTESLLPNCITVDIAIACDKTIYDNKGSVTNAEAFVASVLANVQTNYDNEFHSVIEFNISTIFVPTTDADDPWNGINNIDLHLDKHRIWAETGGYGGAPYSVATAWTRKYSSVIGLAWVGSVCTPTRYNVCTDIGGSVSLLRALQAHELGHSFNAEHDGGSNFIMSPSLTNSNVWSLNSQNAVNNFIKTLGCVGICNSGLPPIADLEASTQEICIGKSVFFTDASDRFPNSWEWKFPGGIPSSSNLQNPVVQYPVTGFYDVTLTAINFFGSSTVSYKKYIEVLPEVIVNYSSSVNYHTLNIKNQSKNADAYLWKFGDGETSIEENPTHAYAKDGKYKVELCCINQCGEKCKSIEIEVYSPLIGNFSSNVSRICAPGKIEFINNTSGAIRYEWELPGANPSISFEKNPKVLYIQPGTYSAKLKIYNIVDSLIITKQNTIRVLSPIDCPRYGGKINKPEEGNDESEE